ncbi:hypothetical protein CVT24_001461 [Panaeolus cyanescens]|uniref:Fe2OG dioxygenase domain-containing protein n=1 Tax=Panaeolus cyanescens TaxID=181874 RepID=A0A409VTD4_9AGAR|nr:hypothetical protein CVT24_001461 [Panaeolus cyanescens]
MPSTNFSEICKSFAESVQAELPYISGSFPLGPDESKLFYQGPNGLGMLDFSKATNSDLEALSNACQPASFGVGGQDVLDASYRKAGKMDTTCFATQFSPLTHGIVDLIREDLFKGEDERGIGVELYKLNVYGPGSFFKAHIDTPRSDNMFGSLVVILPTVHRGGSLIFRHGGKEWTFDSAGAIGASRTASSRRTAFTAFYSDVEHEVTPVISGYRVTLTYNLYFTNTTASNVPGVASIRSQSSATLAIEDHLKSLLSDSSFLHTGGYLGFRLLHKYPVHKSTDLSLLAKTLKGPDARILSACTSLGLRTSLQLFYSIPMKGFYSDDYDSDDDGASTGARKYVMRKAINADDVSQLDEDMWEEVICFLEEDCEGKAVRDLRLLDAANKGSVSKEKSKTRDIYWVNPEAKSATKVESPYVAYGNEASLGYFYGEVAIVAEVGQARKRKTI